MRHVNRIAVAALALGAAVAFAPRALAEGIEKTDWSAHPGAWIAGAWGVLVLVLLGLAGIGCALSVLSVIFPSLRGAMDRQARESSPAWTTLVGVLVGLGVAAAAGGAHHSGSQVAAGIVILALVVPTALLGLAGSLATVPLLGERLLGRKGAQASPSSPTSPLTLAIVGSLALGLSILACILVHVLWILMLAVTLGWPLGVAIGAVVSRIRRRGGAPAADPAP